MKETRRMSETRTFLLEIGTEEIPASYLEPAVNALANEVTKTLSGLDIEVENIEKMWTPRRITLILADIPLSNPEQVVTNYGPPAKIAKDSDGNWTKAAVKFAEKNGVDEKALFIDNSERGEYVAVRLKTGGKKTTDLLTTQLPLVMNKTPFPRNMRWPQSNKSDFARPIRWICCLFGKETIEFEYAGLRSSNVTYGHRFSCPGSININHPDEYVQKLADASVIIMPDERHKLVDVGLKKGAKELGGSIVKDPELMTEVTNLVEYPNVLACSLGGFTDLPREVLQTALAKHQRAFVVEKKGKLIPHFLVVTNSPKLNPELARPWFERMAISRLEDADFFIKEDLEKGLEKLVKEEPSVEWIKGIGSLADKTRFLTELGLFLGKSIDGFDEKIYTRAAYLAKTDLLSNLVREKEFTSLEGIAGAIYAEKLGEPKEVCKAIGDQYSDTPTTPESAVLGITDRLLNICATFLVGKPPKGSRDPFALRRQATAIMSILIGQGIHTDIPEIVTKVLELFGKAEKVQGQIADFLIDREVLFFKDKDFTYDWVDAVIAVAADDPYDAYLRLQAFRELDKADEFRLVSVGQKRVANITRDLGNTPEPVTSLFAQADEEILWKEAQSIGPDVESSVESRNYKKALELLLSIRPAIDRFFDEVFVMVDDEKVKSNRLNLLNAVKQEFLKVADFSKIVVE